MLNKDKIITFPILLNLRRFGKFKIIFQVQKEAQYHFIYACIASYLSQRENNERDYIYALYQD